MIPSTRIENVLLLNMTLKTPPVFFDGVDCLMVETYRVCIGDKEIDIPGSAYPEWYPDPHPGNPVIGGTYTVFVNRRWARANGFAS